MKYNEIRPDNRLRQYVKCYYTYESETSLPFDDTVFPSGTMEIIFNLGKGQWQTAVGETFVTTPGVEFWGQIIRPLPIRSVGENSMLGIRFLPHGAACFFNESVSLYNNQVVDFCDLPDSEGRRLHSELQEMTGWGKRLELVEGYLLQKLLRSGKRADKIAVVGDVMREMRCEDFFDNITNVASRYGITSRYLQKLFLEYTGLTPKLYSKIHRFQNSLRLVTKKDSSLTAIAYDCGYFDQSHFIKEFKSFTGFSPSACPIEDSPVTLALANY